jgi:hypothetical protein
MGAHVDAVYGAEATGETFQRGHVAGGQVEVASLLGQYLGRRRTDAS